MRSEGAEREAQLRASGWKFELERSISLAINGCAGIDEYVDVPGDFFCEENIIQGAFDGGETLIQHFLRGLCASGVDLPEKIEEIGEWISQLIEGFFITKRFYHLAETWHDVFLVFLNAFKLITGKTINQLSVEIGKATEWLHSWIDDCEWFDNDIQGLGNHFAAFKRGFEAYKKIKRNFLLKSGRKLVRYCLAFGLFTRQGLTFENCHYSEVEAAYIKNKYTDGVSFAEDVVEFTLYFLERGAQAYSHGSWTVLLHDGDSLAKWCDKAYELKNDYRMFEANNNPQVTFPVLVHDLHETIKQGEVLMSTPNLDNYVRAGGKRLLLELRFMYCELTATNTNQKTRVAPFAELVCGNSSVAKTLFCDVLVTHFARTMHLPLGEEYTYHRSPGETHWNGYKPYMHTLIYDDSGASNPRKVMGVDPSISELLPVINSNPMGANMAALDDKGHSPVAPAHVVVNTNIEDLHADVYYAFPLALRRRLPYVITVSPRVDKKAGIDYRDPKSPSMLDVPRLPDLEVGEYPNQWNITVKHVIAKPGIGNSPPQVKFEEPIDFTDIYDFLAWYNEVLTHHRTCARKLMRTQEAYKNQQYWEDAQCRHFLPAHRCIQCKRNNLVQGKGVFRVPLEQLACDADRLMWYMPTDSPVPPPEPSETKHFTKIELVPEAAKVQDHMWGNIVAGSYLFASLAARGLSLIRSGAARLADYTRLEVRARLYALCREEAVAAFRAAGQAIWDSIVAAYPLRWMMVLLPLLGGAFLCHKLWSASSADQVQGASESYGVDYVGVKDDSENPWYTRDFYHAQLPISTLSTSWKGKDMQEVARLLSNNIICLNMQIDDRVVEGVHALGLGGHLFVTNNHMIPEAASIRFEVIHGVTSEKVTVNKFETLGPSNFMRRPERDLVFFELHVPPRQNISSLLRREFGPMRFDGAYVLRLPQGLVIHKKVAAIKGEQRIHRALGSRLLNVWCGLAEEKTKAGDCGSVLIGDCGTGPCVLGLHVAGGVTREIEAVALLRTDFEEAVAFFQTPIVSPSPLRLESAHALQSLHPKSIYRYLDGHAEVYGTIPLRPTMKSTVAPTLLAPVLVERGWEHKHGPPVMTGWRPWRNAIEPIMHHPGKIRNDILRQAGDAYLDDILAAVPLEEIASLQILSNLEALNGVPGVKYLEGLNRSSSMGYPWQCSKRFCLIELDDDRWQDGVTFTPEVWAEVDRLLARYEENAMANPIFVGQLKDEPVEERKIVIGKTRVFFVGSGAWSLLMRKWYLSFVRLFQRYRVAFEGMPGLCAQSRAWGKLRAYLTSFGEDRLFAGDFGFYDKVLEAVLTLEAYRIPRELCRRAGWSESEIAIMWGMAEDASFPIVVANGDVARFEGSNPSGIVVTVIVNCIANSLLMRYCYILCNPAAEAHTFKLNVHLATYGDDNVGGVSRAITWFNHSTIRDELEKIGITYTMADKHAETVPFIHIDQVEFLKRSWRWDNECQDYLCPLNETSIRKRLMVGVKSSETPEWQSVVNVKQSIEDYFFYGREKFDQMSSFLLGVLDEAGLGDHASQTEWPSYDELKDRWEMAQDEFSL